MKIRTIIVDDEVLSRRGIEIRLREAGEFEIVAQCANGREALAAIPQYQPDLVFLDIQMPGMSGFEVLAHIPQESLPRAGIRHGLRSVRHPGIRGARGRLPAEADRRCALSRPHSARVREHVRAQSAANQRDRLMQIIAEITGCGRAGARRAADARPRPRQRRTPGSAANPPGSRDGARAGGRRSSGSTRPGITCASTPAATPTSCAAP